KRVALCRTAVLEGYVSRRYSTGAGDCCRVGHTLAVDGWVGAACERCHCRNVALARQPIHSGCRTPIVIDTWVAAGDEAVAAEMDVTRHKKYRCTWYGTGQLVIPNIKPPQPRRIKWWD